MEQIEKRVDMFIGLPCSGKSTYFKKHYDDEDTFVVSMDNIRFEYAAKTGISYSEQHYRPRDGEMTHERFGERTSKGQWSVLAKMNEQMHRDFYQATRQAAREVAAGKRVVVDMTNLTISGRKKVKKWFKKVKDVSFHAVVFEFEQNIDLIKSQNIIRGKEQDKVIPEKVIDDMMAIFQPVSEEEDFASITYIDGLAGLKASMI